MEDRARRGCDDQHDERDELPDDEHARAERGARARAQRGAAERVDVEQRAVVRAAARRAAVGAREPRAELRVELGGQRGNVLGG